MNKTTYLKLIDRITPAIKAFRSYTGQVAEKSRRLAPQKKVYLAIGILLFIFAISTFVDRSESPSADSIILAKNLSQEEAIELAQETINRANKRFGTNPLSPQLSAIKADIDHWVARTQLQRSILSSQQSRRSGFGMNSYADAMGNAAGVAQARQAYQEVLSVQEQFVRRYNARVRHEIWESLTSDEQALVAKYLPKEVPSN